MPDLLMEFASLIRQLVIKRVLNSIFLLLVMFLTACNMSIDASLQNLNSIIADNSSLSLKMESSGGAYVNSPITITATFNRTYPTFQLSDLVVTNATVSALAGGPTTYTFTLTPTTEGLVEIASSDVSYTLIASSTLVLNSPKYELTYDITVPSTPTVTKTSPAAARNNITSFVVIVSPTSSGDTVKIYSDASCSTLISTSNATAGSTSVSRTLATSGIYKHYATVTDRAGNVSACASTFAQYTLDITPPLLTSLTLALQNPASSPGTVLRPRIRASNVDDAVSVNLYRDASCSTLYGSAAVSAGIADIDGTADLADGSYNFYARLIDDLGNTSACSTATVNYVLDTTAPVLAFSSPAVNTVAQTGLTITGTCEAGLTVNLSGAGLASPATTTCAAGTFSQAITFTAGDGTKNIIISQTDAAGNTGTANRDFIKDTTAPTLAFSTPAVNTVAQTGLTITGTCEAGLTVNLSGTGLASPTTTTCAAGTFSQAITFTAGDGTKNIIISQTDTAGNIGTANRDFIKDTTGPIAILSGTPANPSLNNILNVTVGGTDVVNYKYKVGPAATTLCSLTGDYSASTSIATLITDSLSSYYLYNLRICAIGQDAVGNWQDAGSATSYDWVHDLNAPFAELSNLPTSTSSASALAVTVSGSGVSAYKYKVGVAASTDCSVSSGYSSDITVATNITDSISGLADGSVKLCVVGKDNAGNYQPYALATSYSWIKSSSAPSGLSYTLGTVNFLINSSIGYYNPTITGSGPFTYSVSPALPAGIVLNTTSGVISGTPTALAAVQSYTVTATSAQGSTTYSANIAVVSDAFALNLPAEGDAVSGYQVFSGTCTTGETVSASQLSPSTNLVTALQVVAATCRSGKYTIGVNFFGKEGRKVTVAISQKNKSIARTVVYAPSGLAKSTGVGSAVVSSYYDAVNAKFYLAGTFQYVQNSVQNKFLARLNVDGTTDQSFKLVGTGFNAAVRTVTADSSGKVYVAGTFTNYNGTSYNRIARLNSDGSLDTSFSVGTGITGTPLKIAIDANGKILVCGSISSYNGDTNKKYIIRINTDGSIDSSFSLTGSGLNSTVQNFNIDSNGKILVAGTFTSYNGDNSIKYLARLNTDGSLDTSFVPTGSGFNNSVQYTYIDASGKIYAGGTFTSYNGNTNAKYVVRLNSDGTLDSGFSQTGSGLNNYVSLVTVDPSGKVLVSGIFTLYDQQKAPGIVFLNTDGSFYSTKSFEVSGVSTSSSASNGKYLIAGSAIKVGSAAYNNYLLLNSDSSVDESFLPKIKGADGTISSVSIESSGKMAVTGTFTRIAGMSANYFSRLNTDGSFDSSFNKFGSGFNQSTSKVVIDGNGKYLVCGTFTTYNGILTPYFVRLNTDGSLDSSFIIQGTGLNNSCSDIVIDGSGKIYVAGQFTGYNGNNAPRIARLNSDGTFDSSFALPRGAGFNNVILKILIDANGKILAGGSFSNYNSDTSKKYLVRLNTDGSFDSSFTPTGTSFDYDVRALAIDSANKIYVGGSFTNYNSDTSKKYLLRLNSDGSIDSGFSVEGTGLNSAVWKLAIDSSNKINIGGSFTNINSVTYANFARLNTDGTIDYDFNPGNGFISTVSEFAFKSNGNIIVTNFLNTYNKSVSNNLFELSSTGSLINTQISAASTSNLLALGNTATVSGYNGVAPYTYSIMSGSGSINASTGVFTAPASPGSSVIKVSDTVGSFATIEIAYSSNTLSLSPSSFIVSTNSSYSLAVSGGYPPYIFQVVSGGGSVTASGVYSASSNPGAARIRVTDSVGSYAESDVSISSGLMLSPARQNLYPSESVTFAASGGTAPYTYSVLSGAGTVASMTGVYTAGTNAGISVVRATDSMGLVVDAIVNVAAANSALAISPTSISLPVNSSYSFGVTGGAAPYTFTLDSGVGSVSSSGLYSSGGTTGTAVVKVTDSLSATTTASVTVNSALTLTSAKTSVVSGGSVTVSASGGVPPYAYSISAGGGSVGSISGIVTAPNSVGIVQVAVTDSVGNKKYLALNIVESLSLLVSAKNIERLSLSQSVVSGGIPPYAYSIDSGVGTYSTTGVFSSSTIGSAVLRVTDSVGNFATTTVSVVPIAPTVSYQNISTHYFVGESSLNLVPTTSGDAVTSFSISPALPSGLNLNVTSGVISGVPSAINSFTQYVVTATNSGGSSTYAFSFSVVAATNFAVTDPTEAQDVSGYYVINGTCPVGSSVSISSVSSEVILIATTFACSAGNYFFPVRISGSAVSSKVFNVTLANKSIVRTVSYNPTNRSLNYGFNGPVYAVVRDPSSGKYYVGGDFVSFGQYTVNRIARLNSDGSLDLSFNVGTGFDSTVFGVTLDSSGKIYVTGNFFRYNGVTANYIARINTDGSLDTSFSTGSGFNTVTYGAKIDQNGKLVVYGAFTTYTSVSRKYIARINTDGSIDNSFATVGSGLNSVVYDIGLDSNNKIVIAGSFTTYNGSAISSLIRLNTDGSLDSTFTVPGSGFSGGVVRGLQVLSGDKVLAVGDFTTLNSVGTPGIVKLNNNGTVDSSFNPGSGFNAFATPTRVRLDSAGQIIVSGGFANYNGSTYTNLVKLNPNGSLDTSFVQSGTGLSGLVYAVEFDSSDNMIVASASRKFNGQNYGFLNKIDTSGLLKTAFQPLQNGFDDRSYVSQVDSLGRLVVGGSFTKYNGVSHTSIIRFNTDGSVDNTFALTGAGFNGAIHSLMVISGDKVIVAGNFTQYDSTARANIARLNSDGSLDTSFVPPASGFSIGTEVADMAIDANNKILIASNTAAFNGNGRGGLVRLNSNGSSDTSFNSSAGSTGRVWSIAVDSSGKIYAGGEMSAFNGTATNTLIRINDDGSLDTSFVPTGSGFNNTVKKVAIDSSGKILAGGFFNTFNSQSVKYIVKLDSNFLVDNSFVYAGQSLVYDFRLDSAGRIVSVNADMYATNYKFIGRFTSAGAVDYTFNSYTGIEFVFNERLSLDSSDNIYLVGMFGSYAGIIVQYGHLKISKTGSLMP